MRQFITLIIRYPIWATMAILFAIIFGSLASSQLKSSFLPPIDPRVIDVRVRYPGASPVEVEEGATLKIETTLKQISGIDSIFSISGENGARIKVIYKKGYDSNLLLQEIQNAINSITSFPKGMDRPTVAKQQITDFVAYLAVYGPVDLRTLKTIGRKIERDLEGIDGISLVELRGFPEEEIEIAISESQLQALNITIEDVANAVNAYNIKATGGRLRTENDETLIRIDNTTYTAKGLEPVVVTTTADGRMVRLADIADIRDQWSSSAHRSYYNGKPAVVLKVEKTVNEDILEMIKRINAYVSDFNERSPYIKAAVTEDGSVVLKQRISLLVKNGLTGAFFVCLLLSLFLNFKLAFWVAAGIPISFLVTAILGFFMGVTINMVSLFGMIIVVGILVDDGIVIAENIYQHAERGKSPVKAAVDGTLEVLPSVVMAILTTIVAFMPFFFIEGKISDVLYDLAVVVILTLAISLVECTMILPSHLVHSGALDMSKRNVENPLLRFGQRLTEFGLERIYKPAIRLAISNKIATLVLPISFLILTLGAFKGQVIKSTFFPFLDQDSVEVTIKFPAGTRSSTTQKWLDFMEERALALNEELKAARPDKKDVILNIIKSITNSEGNRGEIILTLLDGRTRGMESFKVTQALREKVGVVPGVENLTFGSFEYFGKPISIMLLGNDLDRLVQAKEELKQALSDLPTLKDVTDFTEIGFPEIHLDLKDQAYALGLTAVQVIEQIRHAFFGFDVQRLQRGEDEVGIWVRLAESDRRSLDDLETFQIRYPGGSIPLQAIANFELKRGLNAITHANGYREIRVEADVADKNLPVPPIYAKIEQEVLPNFLKRFPSVTIGYEGQRLETQKTAESSRMVIPVMLFVLFSLIALSFRSFSQGFLVLLILPLGLIGASWGHWLHGYSVSILSVYGIIALIGIMVNDSIVLVNTYNRLLRLGNSIENALYEACISRFRPIVLTSITTIAGLSPLIMETSPQGKFLIPMAISVAYGLAFATLIILLVLPVLILLSNRSRLLMARWIKQDPDYPAEKVEVATKEREFTYD